MCLEKIFDLIKSVYHLFVNAFCKCKEGRKEGMFAFFETHTAPTGGATPCFPLLFYFGSFSEGMRGGPKAKALAAQLLALGNVSALSYLSTLTKIYMRVPQYPCLLFLV
mgnify:CR=1 FL=1